MTPETEIILKISTPEGKTWLARILGPDPRWELDREWLRAVDWRTSCGHTVSETYAIGPGVYQRQSGLFQVTGTGEIVPLASAEDALKALPGNREEHPQNR